jgi:hypothetical protein
MKSKGSFHFQIKHEAKASRRQYQSYGKVQPAKSVLIWKWNQMFSIQQRKITTMEPITW